MTDLYHVRQYRPGFCSGFENSVVHDVPYEGGKKKGCYVMARLGDKGPYALGNVSIIRHEQNVIDAFKNGKHRTRDGRPRFLRPEKLENRYD